MPPTLARARRTRYFAPRVNLAEVRPLKGDQMILRVVSPVAVLAASFLLVGCGGSSPDLGVSDLPSDYVQVDSSADPPLGDCGGEAVIQRHGQMEMARVFEGSAPGARLYFWVLQDGDGTLFSELTSALQTCKPTTDVESSGDVVVGFTSTYEVVDGPQVGESATWFRHTDDIVSSVDAGNSSGGVYGVVVRNGDRVIVLRGPVDADPSTIADWVTAAIG